MKKLYILFVLVIGSLTANSQSFTATSVGISGDPAFFMEGHATINNVSSTPKDVFVQRVVNDLTSGHSSYFCWVQCYSAQVSNSPDFITILPGGNTDVFRGDLETNAIPGISRNVYCFYDGNNPSDSICIEYIFDATTGIADIPAGKNYISKAYPNPATEFTQFYINLNKGVKNAQVKIFNMLGAEVKSVPVTDTRNSLKVNVSNLKGGIYFYSLFIDGKSTSTGKLMISKN
ncbi:MAG: T9SS type A sorting domain-containing protein [Bacteroidia bacterium]|nr:T9SS type A sorting domain-containing protein [Bacteroidia bacterium]